MSKKPKGDHLYIAKCEGCEQKTSLVKETGLCGPCMTGESDTAWPGGGEADFAEEWNRVIAKEGAA